MWAIFFVTHLLSKSCSFRAVSERFQSSFRAVSEQFQSSYSLDSSMCSVTILLWIQYDLIEEIWSRVSAENRIKRNRAVSVQSFRQPLERVLFETRFIQNETINGTVRELLWNNSIWLWTRSNCNCSETTLKLLCNCFEPTWELEVDSTLNCPLTTEIRIVYELFSRSILIIDSSVGDGRRKRISAVANRTRGITCVVTLSRSSQDQKNKKWNEIFGHM